MCGKKILYFVCIIGLLSSCSVEEGKGGLASIQGVVMTQNINSLFEKSGNPYPAADENVFISYGNSGIADDKTPTNGSGVFKFPYLAKGDYTLFVYSDDTASNIKNPKLCFMQSISLDKKKIEATLDTLLIYKHVDFDEGNGIVQGNVQEMDKNGTVAQDTINCVDADVYLQFQNSDEIIQRYRTDAKGNYVISHLIPGKYKLYCLTETLFAWESDTAVVRSFTILNNNTNISLDTIFVNNYK